MGRGVGWGEVGWGGRLQLLGLGLGPDKAVLKLSTDIDWTGLDSFCILLLLIRHMHMLFLVYTHCQLLYMYCLLEHVTFDFFPSHLT